MNKLFYVALYCFRRNEWSHVLVTAIDHDQAGLLAQMEVGGDYDPKRVSQVCMTADEVLMEV